MAKLKVIDFLFYRWRYGLGYVSVSLLLVALLVVAGMFVPDGLTKQEMASAVASGSMSIKNFEPQMIVDAPYHLLQKLSFVFFGVNTISIKLPSLLIAAASTIGMLILLGQWLRQNVAVLAVLLMITAGQFLLLAQHGTPEIMAIFWATWLLLAATMVSKRGERLLIWKIVLFGLVALSLYTPLSIYLLIAFAGAIILHPHLRFLVNNLSPIGLLIGSLVGLLLVSPIIYALVQQPEISLELLGAPNQMPALSSSATQLASQYFNFMNPASGFPMTPLYGLASMLLVCFGLFRIVTTKYTAKSYLVIGWLVLLLPILLVSPTITSVTFVPMLILTAYGIDFLIRYWYRLFPTNPYARAAGLIPLGLLVVSLSFSGIEHFMYGYSYGEKVATTFTKDVSLLRHELATSDGPKTLRVTDDQVDFYKTFNRFRDNSQLSITTDPSVRTEVLIVSHDARAATDPLAPAKIVTNSYQNHADRFYVYKKDRG